MLVAALSLAALALLAGWVRPAEVPGKPRAERTRHVFREPREGRDRPGPGTPLESEDQ